MVYMIRKLIVFVFTVVLSLGTWAQITAPGAAGSDITNYPIFEDNDSIFVFCTIDEMEQIGRLRATTTMVGTKTFLWEKYNSDLGEFEFYFSESIDATFSEISGLEDGGYRVTITLGDETFVQRAWVFNNWTLANASSPDTLSNCDWFKLLGDFTTAEFNYYDLSNNTEINLNKDVRVKWTSEGEEVAAVLNPQIFDPPTSDTDYNLIVYDKFGCEGSAVATYISIVTKAQFSVDQSEGEAPLIVSFENQSENGDPDLYEWFLFRDLDDIKRESEANGGGPVDSIMIVAFEENPVFTYEYTGIYDVKLVSKKVSKYHTCVDTFYIEDYIKVDSSFIEVPNVFTPNGDGTNDNFVVKFWSMETVEISIFNRWGRRIHFYESENVRGWEDTRTATVWDGRLGGGRYASPGVYYYDVVGRGRDGKTRHENGFFHLFRGKD